MGQAVGYTCDQCGKFHASKNNVGVKVVPDGWMILVVPNGTGHENSFDLCSNKCVRLLATTRERELDHHPRLKENGGTDVTERSLRANHQRHHVNSNNPNPNCDLCMSETSPEPTNLVTTTRTVGLRKGQRK